MKKYFVTGLIILLPLALTWLIVSFIFNLFTEPFVGIVKAILEHYGLLENGFLFLKAEQIQKYFSQLIVIGLLFFITVGLGWLARWFFFNYAIEFWEKILNKIPFVSNIYRTCNELTKTLFTSSNNSFKQVVLVPFPSPNISAIGLVTNNAIAGIGTSQGEALVSVFVPTTPNPTSGFLLFYKQRDLVYLDMKVEDALKYVISCGMIATPFMNSNSKNKDLLNQLEQTEIK